MWGFFVPVDAGIDHVFRPVAFLEPFEGVPEIGILFVPALGLHHFRASRHEVFDALHSVLSELRAIEHEMPPCPLPRSARRYGCCQGSAPISVRGVLCPECVLHRPMYGRGGLEFLDAKDGVLHVARIPASRPITQA